MELSRKNLILEIQHERSLFLVIENGEELIIFNIQAFFFNLFYLYFRIYYKCKWNNSKLYLTLFFKSIYKGLTYSSSMI